MQSQKPNLLYTVSDRLTKRTIPEYGSPLASPNFFPIHIMYYEIQKADRPAIRDTDHLFSVLNYKRTQKMDHPQELKKSNSHFNSLMGEKYAPTKGPDAPGFTNGTSCSRIHWWDKLCLHLLIGPAVTGSTNRTSTAGFTKGPALLIYSILCNSIALTSNVYTEPDNTMKYGRGSYIKLFSPSCHAKRFPVTSFSFAE